MRFPRLFPSLRCLRFLTLLCAVTLSFAPARADNAAFDLIGPKIEIRVQRGGTTLPIAEVPNLQAGDRLWIHPIFPTASPSGT